MAWRFRVGGLFGSIAPLLAPFTSWLYLRKFSRKIATRFLVLIVITPIIGYFRRFYVIRQFNSQLQHQIQTKEAEMKQSLSEANLEILSENNNFEYMILVRSQKKYEDEQLFEKQKALFELNNEILSKSTENENYFDGVKFLFIGEQNIYQGLEENLPSKDNNNFDFIKKQTKQGGMMTLPKPDTIQLIAKQPNGDNKIIMEWAFEKDVTLKAIIRQISKHKHKKFVQSMNF